jgi:hypothetical protein
MVEASGPSRPYTAHIEKVGELYTARVVRTAYPPAWESPRPMRAKELYDALRPMGHDSVDIMDALDACDPGWASRNPDFRT